MNFTAISGAQIQETMARMSYFEGWNKDQLVRLSAGAKQLFLNKRERLVAKGEEIPALYILISGQLRLFIPLSNGAERVVSLVSRGESFGEPCLIQDQPCPYEVVAAKDCHVLAIDSLIYKRELRQNPFLVERTLRLVSERFLNTLRDIEICAQPSSMQRVAHYLMHLRTVNKASTQEVRLPALKRDIAAQLALTQETFSRVLAFMAKQDFIQFKGNEIRVEDWDRLHSLAKGGCPMEAGEKN